MLCYLTKVNDAQDLKERMQNGFEMTGTKPGVSSEAGNLSSDVQVLL